MSLTLRASPTRLLHAQHFIDVCKSSLPLSGAQQTFLDEYHAAVAEHLLAAQLSLGRMRIFEKRLAKRVVKPAPPEDVPPGALMPHIIDFDVLNTGRVRFERELRFYLNEARSTLEALAYEIAVASGFQSKKQSKRGEEEQVGFYTPVAFRHYLGATLPWLPVHEYFLSVLADASYMALNDMRRIGYHRRLLRPDPQIRGPAINMITGEVTYKSVDLWFLLFDDIHATLPGHRGDARLVDELRSLLSWVGDTVDSTYALAAAAIE